MNGKFDLQISPGLINHSEFLNFLVLNAIQEEREMPHGKQWELQTGRKIHINCTHGDQEILMEFEEDSAPETSSEETPAENKAWWKIW